MIFFRLIVYAVLLAVSIPMLAAESFFLRENKTHELFGPYMVIDGARIRLRGETYGLSVNNNGRIAFKSTYSGNIYGPFQTVEGRLARIAGVSYTFTAHGDTVRKTPAQIDREFAEPEPLMPKMIAIPEQPQRRVVAPKKLTPLPKKTHCVFASAWMAFLDDTPIDWKLNTLHGSESDIERFSIGGDFVLNSWFVDLTLSPKVQGGSIVPSDVGFSDSSIDGGSGWSLNAGYRRPILIEGSWSVSAGVRFGVRQDKGDLSTTTLVITTPTVTTNTSIAAEYKQTTTSITLTELAAWLDFELAYSQKNWGAYTDISLQPISEYDISGSIPYGTEKISISAERKSPISVTAGCWFGRTPWKVFADLTLGSDKIFRVGGGYNF